MFDSIFNSIDGASASQRDRSVGFAPPLATENDAIGSKTTIVAKLMIDDDLAFTYGEIEFPSFLQILRTAQATDGQIFVDLGCGAGKAVVAAALSEVQFLRITGIELLPALTSCARKAVAGLREMIDKIGDSKSVTSHFEARIAGAFGSSCNLHLPLIDIKEGDILEIDWSDADLVYISSICFPENVLQRIFERATSLKVGSTLITLKLIPGFEKYFELKTEKWFKMTWGSILVYFLTRVASY